MKPTQLLMPVLIAAFAGTTANAQLSKYDVWDEDFNVQGMLGAVKYEDLRFDIADSATPVKSDLSLLPQFGGAWMTLPKGDRFQLGLESSFLMGVQFDHLDYLMAGPGGLRVRLSASMWLFDLAGGVYANLYLDPGKNVRLYAGGGPLMMYANYRTDRKFSDDSGDEVDNESAFGVGGYVRTGLEVRTQEKGMLGIGVRGTWTDIDFSDVGGRSELVGIAGFVTYTAGF